jgi:hypothetical protein
MSAESALEAAPPEAARIETSEGPVVAEAATDVEIEQPSIVEIAEAEGPDESLESSAVSPTFSQSDREIAAARIRKSQTLPPALRDRLAGVVESQAASAADGVVRVPIEAAVRAVEEALPEFLRGGNRAARPEHPAGESFFRGAAAELSDADAEAIARGQLARSGLLRGQRVRVAD